MAWTECPESLAVLGRQRDRWQRGLFQSLTRHRAMLLDPKFGRVGMLAFPYFFFLEMLGLKGTWSAIRKVEGWGAMQRKGFAVEGSGDGVG